MAVAERSPWLAQVERRRLVTPLEGEESTDVIVVGGGIAGLATAYFVLRETDRDVVLLERGRVGHGATGHNAGQVVAAFERRYEDLVREFGEDRVAQAFRETFQGWGLLETILEEMGRPDELIRVQGRVGIASAEDALAWAKEQRSMEQAGLPRGEMVVSTDSGMSTVPEGTEMIEHDELMALLGTKDPGYVAAVSLPLGVINSAILVEAMAEHLLREHPGRFRLFEQSPVSRLRLGEEAVATANGHAVFGERAVLCTNGYRGIEFQACAPPALGGKVEGVVAFMVAKFSHGAPGAEAFFREGEGAPYYYLTRRGYGGRTLTSVGGPEYELGKGQTYNEDENYSPSAYERIDKFARDTLVGYEGTRDFQWKGLMGYTPSMVRVVGQDPGNRSLMYNLGCNGIGLLSSLAGGLKIARLIGGAVLPPSMFDADRLTAQRVLNIE